MSSETACRDDSDMKFIERGEGVKFALGDWGRGKQRHACACSWLTRSFRVTLQAIGESVQDALGQSASAKSAEAIRWLWQASTMHARPARRTASALFFVARKARTWS